MTYKTFFNDFSSYFSSLLSLPYKYPVYFKIHVILKMHTYVSSVYLFIFFPQIGLLLYIASKKPLICI
jgi:hypothetical protein